MTAEFAGVLSTRDTDLKYEIPTSVNVGEQSA